MFYKRVILLPFKTESFGMFSRDFNCVSCVESDFKLFSPETEENMEFIQNVFPMV